MSDTAAPTGSRPRSGISRRRLIAGAGASAIGLAACADDPFDATGILVRSTDRAPTTPGDGRWSTAAATIVALGPQDMALPMRLPASVGAVTVRALHDTSRIAFRLDWDDPDTDDLTVEVDHFRDACAVLLVPGPVDQALRPMGSLDVPATLLHWKADWQRDIDLGRQGIEDAFPNRTIDVYPPLWDQVPDNVDIAVYERAGATEWLPALHVGNPIAVGSSTTPIEKLVAFGFSTTTHLPTQDAIGQGTRSDRGWSVVISKPMQATDADEASVGANLHASCAFAVWSGSRSDAGSRKSPSTEVHRLQFLP